MATKIEYAINPILTSTNNSSFTLHSVDDWNYSRTRELKQNKQKACLYKFQGSMEKLLEKHNLETIRKTMQIHEDIFKQQVREMHRLYRVQKMLMDEMKKNVEKKNSSHRSTSSQFYTSSASRHRSIAQPTFGYNFHVQNVREDRSTGEWCGSQSRDILGMPRGFDLERPAEEGSSFRDKAGFSSLTNPESNKSMGIDGSDDEAEVELTLSIGSCNGKKKMKCHTARHSQEINFCHEPRPTLGRGDECRDPTTTMTTGSSGSTSRQETKRPDWLFQGLSLNRT